MLEATPLVCTLPQQPGSEGGGKERENEEEGEEGKRGEGRRGEERGEGGEGRDRGTGEVGGMVYVTTPIATSAKLSEQ